METGPSGSMTSRVGKSVFLQGLHQILFHQPHDIDFPANDVSQSVPAQSPRLLVRAHMIESEIHVQFLPHWDLGSTSFSQPGPQGCASLRLRGKHLV